MFVGSSPYFCNAWVRNDLLEKYRWTTPVKIPVGIFFLGYFEKYFLTFIFVCFLDLDEANIVLLIAFCV